MQVSCKVSYSVIVYLERQGAQLEAYFENSGAPIELLKDPTCWLSVDEMEKFLVEVAEFQSFKNTEAMYREIGQNNFDLRAWGVLDSVLKMVESPKDIYDQPDRFLSYFLTPHPDLKIEKIADNKTLFNLASKPEADNILAYLIGAVEGLPSYMGKPTAHIAQVTSTSYQISWSDDQESLFDEQELKRRQFHPEIVQSVMQSLQEGTEESSAFTSEAFEKMVAVEVEKRMEKWLSKQKEFDASLFKIKNDFYKMYDYFTRAQQIITLISPSAREASVKEAQRRVDWEHIQKEFPKMVESACDSILAMQDAFEFPSAEEPANVSAIQKNETETSPSVVESFHAIQGGPHA